MKCLPIVLVALLCFAPTAHAKGVMQAEVCGADGCREIEDANTIGFFAEEGGSVPPPTAATGWYRVRVAVGAEGEEIQERVTIAAIPDQAIVRPPGGQWYSMSPAAAETYRAVASQLEPLSPTELGLKTVPPKPPDAADDTAVSAADDGGMPWLIVGLAIAGLAISGFVLARRLTRPSPA